MFPKAEKMDNMFGLIETDSLFNTEMSSFIQKFHTKQEVPQEMIEVRVHRCDCTGKCKKIERTMTDVQAFFETYEVVSVKGRALTFMN